MVHLVDDRIASQWLLGETALEHRDGVAFSPELQLVLVEDFDFWEACVDHVCVVWCDVLLTRSSYNPTAKIATTIFSLCL